MAHCEDLKMCLQQNIVDNGCESSNLTACGRLFSNDELNTGPFRESNNAVVTYLNNDEINCLKKKN